MEIKFNYRKESSKDYGTTGDYVTLDMLNAGSLMRIADAVEKLTLDIDKIKKERDKLAVSSDKYRTLWLQAERRIQAFKGWNTRLKRQAKRKISHLKGAFENG